jgi:S-disulfanyl-L-cysteine oxidoreductase SoxD
MAAFIMRLSRLLPLSLLLLGVSVNAQSPTYGVGRTPTAEEVRAWDISISPTGEELPKGSGTANKGSELFMAKGCAACHGTDGSGGLAPRLVKNDAGPNADPWNYGRVLPIRSPYATTVWDYINRAMPLGQEGTLTPDEVYSLTAFLFFINELIDDETVLDETSLPRLPMPNRDNWAQVPDWFPRQPRLQGYPH